MKSFHEKLKGYREKLKDQDRKWTQQYVADKIGVARVTYTAYENGSKEPPLDTVIKLAELFEVTPNDLLDARKHQPSFEEFIKDPELKRWYKELPKSKEEDLARLKKIWEAFKGD